MPSCSALLEHLSRVLRRPEGQISAALHMLGMGIRLVFMLGLMQMTSPTTLGQYGLACAFEVVLIYLAGLEYHTFTARRYAKNPQPRRLRLLIKCHGVVLLTTMPLAVLIGLALALGMDFSADPWVVGGLLTVIACGMVSQETNRVLILVRRPAHSAGAAFIRSAAWQPCVLPFLDSSSQSTRLIFVSWGIFAFLSMAWTLWLLRSDLWIGSRVPRRYIGVGLWKGRQHWVIATLNVVRSNQERFILQLLLGPASVGIFSFFQTLANTLPSLIQSGVLNVMLPNLLERFARRAQDRFNYLKTELRRVTRWCMLLAAGLCASAIPLIFLLGRHEYTGLVWMLPMLLLAHALTTATQPIHMALYAAHYDRLLLWFSFGTLVAALLLNIVLINSLGMVGAVFAPVFVSAALAVLRWRAFLRLACAK